MFSSHGLAQRCLSWPTAFSGTFTLAPKDRVKDNSTLEHLDAEILALRDWEELGDSDVKFHSIGC